MPTGTPSTIKICSFNGCDKKHSSRGLCSGHATQLRRGYILTPIVKTVKPKFCCLEYCNSTRKMGDYCESHGKQLKRGEELTPFNRRRDAGRPKGPGWHTNASGYIVLHNKKGHPNAWKSGAILEHVFIMSEHLGRSLYEGENVHHKNGVKHDNRLENLELWVVSQPSGQRPEDLLEWADEIIRRYRLQ